MYLHKTFNMVWQWKKVLRHGVAVHDSFSDVIYALFTFHVKLEYEKLSRLSGTWHVKLGKMKLSKKSRTSGNKFKGSVTDLYLKMKIFENLICIYSIQIFSPCHVREPNCLVPDAGQAKCSGLSEAVIPVPNPYCTSNLQLFFLERKWKEWHYFKESSISWFINFEKSYFGAIWNRRISLKLKTLWNT